MKETTKMSRAVGQLEKIYNTLNADLFGGALPVPIITVQSKPGTYGHCTTSKVWRNKESQQYEMNIAAEMLSMEIEEVLDTLIHEMIHLYCRENGIQEVSRGGKYHNGKFKALAEEKGLVCYKAGQYGWNTQGHDNDKLTEYALEKGWSEIKISREGYQRIEKGVVALAKIEGLVFVEFIDSIHGLGKRTCTPNEITGIAANGGMDDTKGIKHINMISTGKEMIRKIFFRYGFHHG